MTGAGRYEKLFLALADRDEGAFVPFAVLGDPDPGASLEVIRTFARTGADAIELGIPFSDPVADGVAIQAADLRALTSGTRVADAWRIVATVREEFPELPIGLLVYANLVLHASAETFYARAAEAGVRIEVQVWMFPGARGRETPGHHDETFLRVLGAAKDAGCRFHFTSDAHRLAGVGDVRLLEPYAARLGIGAEDVHPRFRWS